MNYYQISCSEVYLRPKFEVIREERRALMIRTIDENFPEWNSRREARNLFENFGSSVWKILGDVNIYNEPYQHLWESLTYSQQRALWRSLSIEERKQLLPIISLTLKERPRKYPSPLLNLFRIINQMNDEMEE